MVNKYKLWSFILLPLLAALSFTSCATNGQAFQTAHDSGKLKPLPGKGMVLVYFPNSMNGFAARFHVLVNDQQSTDPVFRGEFKTFDLSPGQHRFSTHPGNATKAILTGTGIALSATGLPLPGYSQLEEWETSKKEQITINVEKGKIHYLLMERGLGREYLKPASEADAKAKAWKCTWKNPR